MLALIEHEHHRIQSILGEQLRATDHHRDEPQRVKQICQHLPGASKTQVRVRNGDA